MAQEESRCEPSEINVAAAISRAGPGRKLRPVSGTCFGVPSRDMEPCVGAAFRRCLFLVLLCLCSVAVANAQVQQPQLFLTFDYHMTPDQVAASHGRYVFVWGDSAKLTSTFVKNSPNTLLSAYFPYARDQDQTKGLAYWHAKHPDWVAYRCDGLTPAYFPGDTNVPLNILNSSVVQWQIAQFSKLRPGLGAVALDNFQFENKLSVCGAHDASGRFIQKYSGGLDEASFANGRIDWLETVSNALHKRNIKVVVNHIPDLSKDGDDPASPLVQRLVGAVDGIVDEHAQDALHDVNKGELLAKLMSYAQSRGKWMYLIYQYQGNSAELTESAMANYLTMAGPMTAIYIPVKNTVSGQEPGLHGFDRTIGKPCGSAVRRDGAVLRVFNQGIAIFALANRASGTIVIPNGYQTVDGHNAGTALHLNGGQGRILYTTKSNGCAFY